MTPYEVARGELGVKEIAGPQHNARILEYLEKTGFPDVQNDEDAWCAVFMNFCLNEAGFPMTHSRMARSFCGYGKTLKAPAEGCIVVIPRGSDKSKGHVGFYSHEKDGLIYLLGGNQGNAVSVAAFRKPAEIYYRAPHDTARMGRDKLVVGTGVVATGANQAIDSGGSWMPNAPDLSLFTGWQGFTETVSTLAAWAWLKPQWLAFAVVCAGAALLGPKLIARWKT